MRVVNTGDWQAQPAQNVMLITAISPAYRAEAALALEKQIEGAYVVGIGPDLWTGSVPPAACSTSRMQALTTSHRNRGA